MPCATDHCVGQPLGKPFRPASYIRGVFAILYPVATDSFRRPALGDRMLYERSLTPMSLKFVRTRIYAFPYNTELFDARLIAINGEVSGRRTIDIVLDVDLLRPHGEPEPVEVEGRPAEMVRGEYVPHRLRFRRAQLLQLGGVYAELDAAPLEHEARRLYGILHWRTPVLGESYLVFSHTMEPADLILQARGFALEPREGPRTPAEYVRRWAFTPPRPAGLIPERGAAHRQFGGDPVTIRLGGRRYRNRLFIGGMHHQTDRRPQVDHVLNLCELPNAWTIGAWMHPADRHACKGEMALGMTLAELRAEAEWVVERLTAGERVLVHCFAGANRSATVCCAALMLLEGLTAEQALARVREHHPGCCPDPYYWFLLLRLKEPPATPSPPAAEAALLLRDELPVG
jgi:hypothetical protein